jgi:DNA-binding NarL/FixJ family response regulator
MSILIAEDNAAQRSYLREILAKQFDLLIIEAENGDDALKFCRKNKPELCILDIQMPQLSGVKAAKTIWKELPATKIIFWTQFPHEIYINEIRKIIKTVNPTPTYGFIHKNNPENRLIRFISTVLEDGADMIDPAFKDSFKRPLLTDFEAEALRYLSLGLSNWAIARKCSLSQRGVESRLATLYEKLNHLFEDSYEKLAFNVRTRAFCEALKRGLINSDELEKAELELQDWLERDRTKFLNEKTK